MWILKNSKDLLDNLKSRSFSRVSSIKTFDLSTLYTTLPHDKLKTRLKETIHKAFSHRNYGSKCVVLCYNSAYFSNKTQKGETCYSYESEFLQKFIKDKKIHEARAFNFTCRYIDDVLSITNSRFAEFLPCCCVFCVIFRLAPCLQ